MHLSVQEMTSLPVSVLVLGIGIARHQSIGNWVLGAKLGIVLTLMYIPYGVHVGVQSAVQCTMYSE